MQWEIWNQKSMKECGNQKSRISSKLHIIYICSNNVGHPVTKPFTPLHYNCQHFISSHLNFTQLHFTTFSFGLTPFKFPNTPFYLTSLHFTSLHCTFRWFYPHFYYFHFTPFIIAFLTLFLKIIGLQGKVHNASAGSWFQFLMVLFTKEYFLISVLCFLSLIFRTWWTLLK
jgi:hypothetical protein